MFHVWKKLTADPWKEEQKNPIQSMAVRDSPDPSSGWNPYVSEITGNKWVIGISVEHAAISNGSQPPTDLPTDLVLSQE